MLLQGLESIFTPRAPFEGRIFLQQFCHGLGDDRKIWDEFPIIPRKSEKTTDVLDGLGSLPIQHVSNLTWID